MAERLGWEERKLPMAQVAERMEKEGMCKGWWGAHSTGPVQPAGSSGMTHMVCWLIPAPES